MREKQQRDCRYVRFDVEALCQIAASTGFSTSPVREVEKLEGGFSKALRLRKEDGTELIAKIPCPNAGLVTYTTASEVAVLEYGMYASNYLTDASCLTKRSASPHQHPGTACLCMEL